MMIVVLPLDRRSLLTTGWACSFGSRGPRTNGAFDSPVNTEGAFDYSVLRADYADAMLSNSCGISASVIPVMLMLPLKK
jgi:hypothetical protein